MRVALISSYSPSLTNFRGELVRALIDRGHTVLGYGPEDDDDVRAALKSMGATLRVYPLARAGMNPAADIRSMLALARRLRRDRVDVVLTYTMKPNAFGSMAAKLAGVPRIFSLVTGLGYAFIGKDRKARTTSAILSGLLKAAFAVNDRVFVYNRDIEDEFRRRGLFRSDAQPMLVPGTGVDLTHFDVTPPSTAPVTFLLIARLLVDKGIREYVDAARTLRPEFPDARFVLVGPYDPNPAALQPNEVEAWLAEGVVEYAGATADVRPFLHECSVYVLPSYAEGVPRTVLEAMACGRAVITTHAPGCRDTIEEGVSGRLVAVRQSAPLAAAMRQYLEHRQDITQHGVAARRRAEAVFDVNVVNRILLDAMGL